MKTKTAIRNEILLSGIAERRATPYCTQPSCRRLRAAHPPFASHGRLSRSAGLLVESAGTPVSKDVLIEAVWPGLAVEESNLTVQIAALRRVFAQEPGGERWIETLPRRGYRFVGLVERTEVDISASASQTGTTPPAPDKPSIAILPFENLSGDPEQEYFSDGMADDLITDISKISGIYVAARNSSFAFKGKGAERNCQEDRREEYSRRQCSQDGLEDPCQRPTH
jgi:DNA-binding winged helix-turn-helix (wHTH) protein